MIGSELLNDLKNAARSYLGPQPADYHQLLQQTFAQCPEPFAVRLWNGEEIQLGQGAPQFKLIIKQPSVLENPDEDAIAWAYFHGHWDIEGDPRAAFALRPYLKVRTSLLSQLQLLTRVLLVRDSVNNQEAIGHHYSLGDDFYLCFLDQRHRIYSHGHFRHEQESLEDAQTHKLQDMYDALALKPGMTLLDIGGGWGAVPEFAGARGVKVTSLTLAPDSYNFITNLIAQQKLDCRVELTDFLEYQPAQKFDAIVIYGVIEHIPQYRRFVEKIWECLKPGGLMYLDASATRIKYDMNAALKKTIWPTTTAYLAPHDLIAEINYGSLDLLEFHDESKDYELTMYHWARRFDENRDFIIRRWGEWRFRTFQLYLWGGYHTFRFGTLQACRMLIRRPAQRQPKPSWQRRLLSLAYAAK